MIPGGNVSSLISCICIFQQITGISGQVSAHLHRKHNSRPSFSLKMISSEEVSVKEMWALDENATTESCKTDRKTAERDFFFQEQKLEHVEEEDMAEQIWFRGGSVMWGASWRNEPLMIRLGFSPTASRGRGGMPLLWLDEEGQTLRSPAADGTALVDTWFVFSGLSRPPPPPPLAPLDRKSVKPPGDSLYSIWLLLVSVRERAPSSAWCV